MTGAQDTSCNLRQGVQEKKFKLLEKVGCGDADLAQCSSDIMQGPVKISRNAFAVHLFGIDSSIL